MAGSLGSLPGMMYDPIRNRYFPRPKTMPPPKPDPHRNRPREPQRPREPGREKRIKLEKEAEDEDRMAAGPSRRPKTGRMMYQSGQSRNVQTEVMAAHFSLIEPTTVFRCTGSCGGEVITSLRSYVGGAFYATTDHGKVIIHRADGETHGLSVCESPILGIHCDLPRMTMMAVAGGPEAHVHHFRRDPQALDFMNIATSELDLPQGDIFSMSSFDDICSIGGHRCIDTIRYTEGLSSIRRKLPSDCLALHHADHNLLYAGLRSGMVTLEDLRVDQRTWNKIATTSRGKAVVGVKRLKDSAVPWGIAVSGMSDDLCIYDVRYNREPLLRLEGHVNSYVTEIGLTTSPDDQWLFAAGSDTKIRAWNTTTGCQLLPPPLFDSPPTSNVNKWKYNHPLVTPFDHVPTALSIREDDWGMDVAVKGELHRFRKVTEY